MISRHAHQRGDTECGGRQKHLHEQGDGDLGRSSDRNGVSDPDLEGRENLMATQKVAIQRAKAQIASSGTGGLIEDGCRLLHAFRLFLANGR